MTKKRLNILNVIHNPGGNYSATVIPSDRKERSSLP